MNYQSALQRAVLIKRYQRFLADIRLQNGTTRTIYCPNTGAMLGCAEPGFDVWYSRSDNPKRRYAHTLEQVAGPDGVRIGVNTGTANALVREALANGLPGELSGYDEVKAEVTVETGSRLDFTLHAEGRRRAVVEVKNVSAAVDDGVAFFPDAVSVRALKHLTVLQRRLDAGDRSVLIFCVQRDDVREVRPADHIDPAYGRALRQARSDGVEMLALAARLGDDAVTLYRPVPVVCPPL